MKILLHTEINYDSQLITTNQVKGIIANVNNGADTSMDVDDCDS